MSRNQPNFSKPLLDRRGFHGTHSVKPLTRPAPGRVPEPYHSSTDQTKSGVSFQGGVGETDTPQTQRFPPPSAQTPDLATERTNSGGSQERRLPKGRRLDRESSIANLKAHRNSMLATKGRETRRERTFIGTRCAACEEPLEHTLRGERVLQLSCGHVSHEACLYEYVKEMGGQECPSCEAPLELDTSRGPGTDFDLNGLVRSVQTPVPTNGYRDHQPTPASVSWDRNTSRPGNPPTTPHNARHHVSSKSHLSPELARHSEYSSVQPQKVHGRNESGDTAHTSNDGYADTHPAMHSPGRRHDYDVQSMETKLSNPRLMAKNPVPAPIVTIRSEFPTLSKSRHQQSLTCLITVEAVDGKWQPNPDDLRGAPPAPVTTESQQNSHINQTGQQPEPARPVDSVHEAQDALNSVKDELIRRVDSWHGLDYTRFGRLVLHGTMKVGKDRQAWQELECYLFAEMLICVKEKKSGANASQQWDGADGPKPKNRCTLKGSILIRKHLKDVEHLPGSDTLTLSLSVTELPAFHLQFQDQGQMEIWRRTLLNLEHLDPPEPQTAEYEQEPSGSDEDDYTTTSHRAGGKAPSVYSSNYGANRSHATAPTEYTNSRAGLQDARPSPSNIHVPTDVVVVVPVSSSMQGLKINLLRDALRFLVSSLGERDRMGLVTFGSGAGGAPIVGMTNKTWPGWSKAIEMIKPVGHKSMRADVVEGANVAMDLLMQRKTSNPLSSILLISDAPTSDYESVDFVVSRAEAAKITIHSFGLGLTHKPDTMVELSNRTKASYTYVKDWMMLRECLAGCFGSLQSTSHQNVKLKLRLPEGSPAKFVKISGALQTTKRATGKEAEAALGDLRFGDKRDILVQLVIASDTSSTPDAYPSDAWENIISGLEALGGPLDQDETRTLSVEELPLIQADLVWGDILRDGSVSQLPRPSLLAITMLPCPKKDKLPRPLTPPIPPHPSIVQRRMELLTSDMLSRALTLIAKGQHDRANHLLTETRSILKGLGKGGLPPLPPPPTSALPPTPKTAESKGTPTEANVPLPPDSASFPRTPRTPSPPRQGEPLNPFTPAAGIDPVTVNALDSELEAALEWVTHPAQFSRDSRKAVLQTIGVISSQRAYTFRSHSESLWAIRIPGVKRLTERSRQWRDAGDERLTEE